LDLSCILLQAWHWASLNFCIYICIFTCFHFMPGVLMCFWQVDCMFDHLWNRSCERVNIFLQHEFWYVRHGMTWHSMNPTGNLASSCILSLMMMMILMVCPEVLLLFNWFWLVWIFSLPPRPQIFHHQGIGITN
jgi:hypothetical protein